MKWFGHHDQILLRERHHDLHDLYRLPLSHLVPCQSLERLTLVLHLHPSRLLLS